MEERILKVIKTTTVPFPLYIYKTSVTYNEVRKASGVASLGLHLHRKECFQEPGKPKINTVEDLIRALSLYKKRHNITKT